MYMATVACRGMICPVAILPHNLVETVAAGVLDPSCVGTFFSYPSSQLFVSLSRLENMRERELIRVQLWDFFNVSLGAAA